MNNNCLRFLHLSDIHFSKEAFSPDLDLRNDLEIDAKELIDERGLLSGILISGDIAFSGQVEEYKIAIDWLEKLCTKLSCPPVNIWCVPGNHDVNRNVIAKSKLIRDLQEKMKHTRPEDIDNYLEEYYRDQDACDLLFKSIENYSKYFASLYNCEISSINFFTEHDFILTDNSILRMHGVNSTLFSSDDDDDGDHKLIIGARQGTLTRQNGVEYILLCHHPYSWLKDKDSREDHWGNRARIQLFGHKHRQRINQNDNSVILASGAMHPDRREPHWEPKYNLLEIDVTNQEESRKLNIDVYQRIWKQEDQKFLPLFDSNGRQFKDYHLQLEPWESNTVNVITEDDFENAQAISDNRIVVEEISRKDDPMDPARNLTYRFLRLPFHKRIEIASKLGLVEDEDEGINEGDLFQRFFRKAKGDNKLGKLWEEVETAHGNTFFEINPFIDK